MRFYNDIGSGIGIGPNIQLGSSFQYQRVVEKHIELFRCVGRRFFKHTCDDKVAAESIEVPFQGFADEIPGGMEKFVCEVFRNSYLVIIGKELMSVALHEGTGE